MVCRHVFPAGTEQGFCIFSGRKAEIPVVPGLHFKARDPSPAERNIRDDIVDLLPGDLYVILDVSVIIKFKGLIPDHNLAVILQTNGGAL